MNKNLNAKLHPQLIAICLGLFVLFYTIQTCFAETENSIENKVSTKIIERKTQLPITAPLPFSK